MANAISRRRLALFVFFFIPGFSIASWVTRTPAIRDSIHASIAEMGFVLLGLSLGSMIGILLSGPLISRLGTRPVALIGTCLIPVGLLVMGLGVSLGLGPVVSLGLGLFGLGMGVGEIAINIDGAAIEQLTGRPLMHALHGCFSFGTVCGALCGFALTALDVAVQWHLGAIAILTVPVIFYFVRFIPPGTARTVSGDDAGAGPQTADPFWRDIRLYFIGVIVLAMALAEGAANDWLPIIMVDEYHYSQSAGSLVFLIFASAMTIGRFTGGFFLVRYGRAHVMRGSALLGAVGLALVVFAQDPILAGAAVLLWGLGASLGFPVAISAAGGSGPNATARVKVVTIGGYIAFLVGPPLLGLLGEAFGLRGAMLLVLLLVIIAACVAQAVQPRSRA